MLDTSLSGPQRKPIADGYAERAIGIIKDAIHREIVTVQEVETGYYAEKFDRLRTYDSFQELIAGGDH